ncbi:MAG TPA: metal-dependent transcriptional regulator [Candidatus Onthovivens sp.]|nr:metal-dependent transcriptional regulator [Candidatus Onthovivens sp.]
MELLESSEDYLERILMLQKEIGTVRSIDLANSLNYSKASVSVAMKKLKENKYIIIDELGYIFLTLKGKEIANKVLERHEMIAKIFVKLGVSEKQALIDACKVEHCLSEETFNAIKETIKKKDLI